MDTFGPGAAMCARFYARCIRPILDAHFPGLPHAAGLLDSGSEVLGYDDALSRDHDWGPRAQLFLGEADCEQHAAAISTVLAQQLPLTFEGFPTNFAAPDATDGGTRWMEAVAQGPVSHKIAITSARRFWRDYLNLEPGETLDVADWLSLSEQRLLTVTRGPLFHDGIGLQTQRAALDYYPRDVWLYLLAAGWQRISQEEHLMGRAGQAGDELGSALIASRLVRDVMRLSFLMARRYAPYPKWLGSAFRQLPIGAQLYPVLQSALRADDWQTRERHLVTAYQALMRAHNALGLTAPLAEAATLFFGRPFQVITHNGVVDALIEQIADPAIAAFTRRAPIGSLDLFSDNTDLTSHPERRLAVRQLIATCRVGHLPGPAPARSPT